MDGISASCFSLLDINKSDFELLQHLWSSEIPVLFGWWADASDPSTPISLDNLTPDMSPILYFIYAVHGPNTAIISHDDMQKLTTDLSGIYCEKSDMSLDQCIRSTMLCLKSML